MDLNAKQLLERVQEQEDVIRQLWQKYKQDVGSEPEISDLAGNRAARYVPVPNGTIQRALHREKNFEEAVEEFDFQWTHSYTEASTQRLAGKLLHSRKPAVVSRKAGDVVLRGFWGKGVSMPIFEKLLQKLRGFKHGSIRRIDLSDNGLNGNFVPGIIEIIRRGARQLDLSQNSLESVAAQQLCNSLPQIAQFLEVIDLRHNPCESDAKFVRCLAGILSEMKFLERLAVTVRCAPDEGPISHHSRPTTPQRDKRPSAWLRGGRASTPQPRQQQRASTPGRSRPQMPEVTPHRVRAMSQAARSHAKQQTEAPPAVSAIDALGPLAMGGAGGRDAAVSLFRAVAESPQLRVLDLRSSQLSRPAVQRFAQFIRSDQLIGLSMADCFLGDLADLLLDAVSVCHNIIWLNMRLNAMSGDTGIKFCHALDASISLTEVDLASNELGDDFGVAFATVLASNEVLMKIDLIRNPLGLRTGDALLQVLQRDNSTLVSIGDTVDNFFCLGLQNRYQIEMILDANRKGLELAARPADGLLPDVMDPGLASFEWRILDDEPVVLEPMALLR